jgi:hypothetical protein
MKSSSPSPSSPSLALYRVKIRAVSDIEVVVEGSSPVDAELAAVKAAEGTIQLDDLTFSAIDVSRAILPKVN